MSPRGRRPAGQDTRGLIVDAARAEFAEQGYDAVSMRAIARRAAVDAALVHHYFDGKAALFAEVVEVPADPTALIRAVVDGPREQVGESLARTFLAVWDSDDGRARFQGILRSAVSHDEAARMLREFVAREVFGRVAGELGDPSAPDDLVQLRAGLAAAQMIGVAMMRYVLLFPPVAAAAPDDLVAELAPVLQRYLVG